MRLKLSIAILGAFLLYPQIVLAQVVTTGTPLVSNQWTQATTTCPMHLSAIGHGWYAVSTSTPSLGLEGHPIPVDGLDVYCPTTASVWGRTLSGADKATMYTSPITARGGGGGGGGTFACGLGLTGGLCPGANPGGIL